MSQFSNPTDLVGIDRDPSLARLLRACGVEEAYISGGASSMDKFLALAEIMPLCVGHSTGERIHRLLQDTTGLTARLCPHTARPFWDAWVHRYWYGRGDTPPVIMAPVCPLCTERKPLCVELSATAILPEPSRLTAENLGAWTSIWETILTEGGDFFVLDIPQDYRFVRPNPYHAGEAIRKAYSRELLSESEQYLLLTQSIRVFGQWALRTKAQSHLILRGGESEAILPLLAYLQSSRSLASMVWLPRDPTEAEAVSGLYACVRTGMDLSDGTACVGDDPRIPAYRKIAPWGAAVILR